MFLFKNNIIEKNTQEKRRLFKCQIELHVTSHLAFNHVRPNRNDQVIIDYLKVTVDKILDDHVQ